MLTPPTSIFLGQNPREGSQRHHGASTSRHRPRARGREQAPPVTGFRLPSHLALPGARGSSPPCPRPGPPSLPGCSANSNRGGGAEGRQGACHHQGPAVGLAVSELGPRVSRGRKEVWPLVPTREEGRGGVVKAWCSGTPGLSPGLAKGELSVLGWTLGVRGTPQYQKATEVQEAVPSRLGEAAPHPWSAAPGSPTGRTQGLISCRKNLAQGRLGLPHLGTQWPGPGRAQPLTLSRCLQVQKAGPALVQTQGQGPHRPLPRSASSRFSPGTPRTLPAGLQLSQALGSPARPSGQAHAGDAPASAQAQQGRWLVLESGTSDHTPLSPGILYSNWSSRHLLLGRASSWGVRATGHSSAGSTAPHPHQHPHWPGRRAG